jgi:hypothetical protein
MTIKAIVKEGCKIVQPVGADAPEITTKFRDPGGCSGCTSTERNRSENRNSKAQIRRRKFVAAHSMRHGEEREKEKIENQKCQADIRRWEIAKDHRRVITRDRCAPQEFNG